MAFMARYDEIRSAPERLLPGALNAISLGLPYYQGDAFELPSRPTVAQYARLRDYHRVLREKAEGMVVQLKALDAVPQDASFRVLVDTAPVLERALAAKSAEGFIGKNTCYIHPRRGSFLMLAEILSSHAFGLDEREPIDPKVKSARGGCGECKRCQVHCPTGALDDAYRIDSGRCLAYWTIEHRGPIPERFWPWLAKYYFGCDICQLVCPYNWKASGNTVPSWLSARELPDLFQTATMDQADYERYFGGTPMTRAKRNGLRRNALIALAVTKDPRLGAAMEAARRDDGSPVRETLAQIEKLIK
jgi:epoxyqueuosine reductase